MCAKLRIFFRYHTCLLSLQYVFFVLFIVSGFVERFVLRSGGEGVALGGLDEGALCDELGDGSGEGRAGDAEDEGGLLQVGYRAVVLNVAYDAR